MRNWGIKFSGDSKSSVEDFFERIDDVMTISSVSGPELLRAAPLLVGIALLWYRHVAHVSAIIIINGASKSKLLIERKAMMRPLTI